MTITCPRHDNVMQFLEASKKLSSDLTRVLHVLEKSYFNFALNVFFLKELKGAILSQNYRRSQGVAQGAGPGARAHSIEMPPMTNI